MFTAFMVALTLTTVANVLVTMALAPLFTALAARAALGHRLPAAHLGAIARGRRLGIAWMYGHEVAGRRSAALLGTAGGAGVPVAAAVNWTLLQHLRAATGRRRRRHAAGRAAGRAAVGRR
jgi:hypothetical protein